MKEMTKQIEGGHNKVSIKLLSTHNQRGSLAAMVEVGIARDRNIRHMVMTVEDGDDMEQETGSDIYKNCRIGAITCATGNHSIEISMMGGKFTLHPGDVVGG